MAQTKIIGGGAGSPSMLLAGVENAVDPTHLAARIAMRPLDHAGKGRILGHYKTFQRSGEIAATLAANGKLASIRWPDQNAFCVLTRLKVGVSISADVTAAGIELAYKATVARGFSVDFTAAATALNMATIANTNAMRKTMGGSLMGTAGPRICTTVVQSGDTLTLDTNPFAGCVLPGLLLNTNSTGTAVLGKAGSATPMTTMYECTSPYDHPLVLSYLEGVVIQTVLAGYATGTFALYTQWEWAEVEVF